MGVPAMQLDSYVGLLTEDIWKISRLRNQKVLKALKGLQRVVGKGTYYRRPEDEEQKFAEMESMYKSKIEKLKIEHTECQDSFQEKASLQDSLSALKSDLQNGERKKKAETGSNEEELHELKEDENKLVED